MRWGAIVKYAICAVSGGVTAAIVVWFLQAGSFRLMPLQMSYADLSATALSAASVILTGVGVAVGAMALWGYAQFKQLLEAAVRSYLDELLATEETWFRKEIQRVVTVEVDRAIEHSIEGGRLSAAIRKRVDEMVYSGGNRRADPEPISDEF